MHQRTRFMLAGAALLGLAILAPSGFGQTNVVPSGIFQINIAKSTFPGAPFKSETPYFDVGAQKMTVAGIGAQGNPFAVVYEVVEDGKPHSVKGLPVVDAITYTRVDPYTLSFTSTKDGKVVRT